MSGSLADILIIVVLIILNGIFVAAEFALVTIRRTRVQQLVEQGNRGARRIQRLTAHTGRFLAVIQLGVTFVGFLAAAFAGVSLAQGLETVLRGVPVLEPYAAPLALLVVTAVLSFVTIVFGELVPKTLALAHAERFALILGGPVELLGRLLGPIVWLLTRVTDAITRVFGVGDVDQNQMMSTAELKLLVERGGEQGILEAEEEQMINAVIELGERRVHEVMVPRTSIVAMPMTATLEQAIDMIVEEGHSRIPIYEQSVDEIIGILYAKDLLQYLKPGAVRPALRALLRTPLFVPESMSIDDLLHEFQRRKVHIAVVLDEYGGTAGLVTIEDLLEEIVGEIQDEYDEEEPMIERLSESEVRVDGRAAVDQLAELFDVNLNLEDEDEYDTVGGLIYHRIGGVPSPGDQVRVDGLQLTVESTDGRRVSKVLVVRTPADDGTVAVGDEADR